MQDDLRTTNVRPLKEAFQRKFLIGTALSVGALQGRAQDEASLAAYHFNAFTPENSLKPEAVQPREGEFRFAEGDRLVEIARRARGIAVGHTLVWHAQTARWMFEGIRRQACLARGRSSADEDPHRDGRRALQG